MVGQRKRARNDRRRQNGRENPVHRSGQLTPPQKVLEGFQRTVHELLIVPETGLAYVPIYGDGIHGRNPNPGHTLCIIDLARREHVGDIDLRPYIAPHTLKLGPDGLIYVTCENSAVVAVVDPKARKVVEAIEFGLDQRPQAHHLAGRKEAVHGKRGGRRSLVNRSPETQTARQDQDTSPAGRYHHFRRRKNSGRRLGSGAGVVPDRHHDRARARHDPTERRSQAGPDRPLQPRLELARRNQFKQ